MDNLFFFALGLLVGWFFTWAISGMRGRWKQRRDLRAAVAKTKKETAEKSQKAKQDSHKATGVMFRAILDGLLLLGAALIVGWVLWITVFQ